MHNIELLLKKWSNGTFRKRMNIKSVVQHSLLIPVLAVLLVGCNTKDKQSQNSEPTPIAPSTQSETPATSSQTPATSSQTETINETQPTNEQTLVAVREESDLKANLEKVYFNFDSYAITSSAKEKLLQMAQLMKNNQKLSIQISGYTDERGTEEYNLNLGQMRAQAVKEFLAAQGVNPQMLSTISYGEKKPVIQGSTSKAWTQNRRVEFKIVNSVKQ